MLATYITHCIYESSETIIDTIIQFENTRGPYGGFGHTSHLSSLTGFNHHGLNPAHPTNYTNPPQQEPKGLDPNLAKHFPIHNLTGPTKNQINPKVNKLILKLSIHT